MPETPQTELNRADKWIYGVLSDSSAVAALVGTRIYRHKAPGDTDFPCLIFACQSASDRNVLGAARLVTQAMYAIRSVARLPATEDAADVVAATADAAISDASADEHMLCIERMEPWNRSYVLDGIDYEERGGIYRVWLKGD